MSRKPTNIHNLPPQKRIEMDHYSNGGVWSKTFYMNDKKYGMATHRREDGSKEMEIMWVNNKTHGMISWWRDDATKSQQSMHRDDKSHGIRTLWYKNAQKQSEVYFLIDKECARIEWDEKGKVSNAQFPTATTTAKSKPIAKPKADTNKGKKNDPRNKSNVSQEWQHRV